MADGLYDVDLAFVVDTTGSMGSFIAAARQQMVDTLERLAAGAEGPVSLRLAVVEYRDHPPQEQSFVARPHPFTADSQQARKVIAGLTPSGGGDGPEAVFDGLDGCAALAWRPNACRLAVLVGDAPPHGVGAAGDGFRAGCPCGLTTERVAARLEAAGVRLVALALTPDARPSFGRLAGLPGGESFAAAQGREAVEAVRGAVARQFADIDHDRRVLERCRAEPAWTVDGLSTALESRPHRVAASLCRLGRRGFLEQPA
jgi:hypothetical protein